MRKSIARVFRAGRRLLLAGFVVATGGSAAYLAAKAPQKATTPAATNTSKADAELKEKILRDGKDGVFVPDSLARNMGLRTVAVAARTRAIPLPPLQGCLALDTNRLARIHSRFAGEVVALGTRAEKYDLSDPDRGANAEPRPVRVGDFVRQGDLLAVVWSKDLGEKKSELVDAASRLRADEVTLRRLEAAYREGSVPERSLRDAERAVEADRIAVKKVEQTLSTWQLTDEEIAGIGTDAERSTAPAAKRPGPATWARVEVRSSRDGVVVEKNVLSVGQWVDPSAPLFQVCDLSSLMVWVHIFEEDLPLLQSLPRPVRWTVQLPSRPGVKFPGRLEQVGAVIDPNQHTALATGRVENPKGDLKAGQFVTVSVELPPPGGEIELPADAVVEDGRESVVFVQTAGAKDRFVCTPVRVTSRFRDVVCVRSGGGVAAGDHVVTGGALLLRDAMDQLSVPQQ